MGAERLKVVTEDLTKLSQSMTARPWPSATAQAKAADGLPLANDAATNLNANARELVEFQKLAEAENQRLAETLSNVAIAYDAVDHASKEKIDGLGGRTAAIEAITIPAPATQLPAIPAGGPSMRALDGGGYGEVMQTQALLTQGDFGTAIVTAQGEWSAMKGAADAHAEPPAPTNWEGDAASAAYTRLNSYSTWLGQLSDAWQRLIKAAETVRTAHVTAVSEHSGVAEQYAALETQLKELSSTASQPGLQMTIMQEMKKLHERSDEIRAAYANSATFDAVRPVDPPFGSPAGSGSGVGSGGGSGSGGGAGGGQPAAASPMSTGSRTAGTGGTPQSGSPSKGGSPSGGGSPAGGGSPVGGGSPAGGGSPGTGPSTAPGGPATDLPRLPDDPSLHPAAAAAGGGAGGGSGGGAGGGAGPMPLQPNVGGVAVGPATAGGGAAGGAPAGAGPGGGAAGGMGGMPMGGHGQGQGGGKERRRTPGLSPDEDLYTEERPWTEAIIGNRRRRDVADTKDSK